MATLHGAWSSEGKSPSDVPAALNLAEITLGLGRDDACQKRGENWNPPPAAHLTGQQRGLVKSPFGEARRVKGNGDQPIHLFEVEVPLAGFSHESAEGGRQGRLPPILERMNRRPQRIPIVGRGPGIRVRRRPAVTTLAEECLGPNRIREPTRRAPGGRDGKDPLPAGTSERVLAALAEGGLTGGTEGRKEQVDERLEKPRH